VSRLDRLKAPPTLDPNALREQVDAAHDEAEAPKADPKADPKTARAYTFPFRFQSGPHVYEGTFTNRVLTVGERMKVGTLFARITGGVAIEALPTDVTSLARAIAWMTYSLEGERPAWARNLAELADDGVIYALFAEVWSHQTTFLGRANNAEPATAGQ